jgi:hypothetical protein
VSTQVKKIQVTLTAHAPVQLDSQVTLAAGSYPGTEKRLGVPVYAGRISWTNPEYSLVLTQAQLEEMGAPANQNFISTEYDVTKHVRTGEITVS